MATTKQKISTKMFFFHKEDKMFTQEASSLGNVSFTNGFVLVSHVTGKEVPFVLNNVERDREGDIMCWNFKPADVWEILKDVTVCVFND